MSTSVEIRINGRYKIQNLIGNGVNAQVFSGTNVHSSEEIAIKLEEETTKTPVLLKEAQILKKLQGGLGVPLYFWSGKDGDYNCLVMELLGQSLKEKLKICKNSFSLKTTLMIADQAVGILDYIHENGIIHRDLKPRNFCLGKENNFFQINLIDFGSSRREDEEPIPTETDKFEVVGKIEFSSIASHEGKNVSRKDDLESLMYMILYLLTGTLPWMVPAYQRGVSQPERLKKVLELKRAFKDSEYWDVALIRPSSVDPNDLEPIPKEIKEMYLDIIGLGLDEKPQYNQYRKILREILVNKFLEYDYIYDWMLVPVVEHLENDSELSEQKTELRFDLDNQEKLKSLIQAYEEDPSVIDFKMEQIKKQHSKFDMIGKGRRKKKRKSSAYFNADARTEAGGRSHGNMELQPLKKSKTSTGKKKKRGKKKDKDCVLI